MNTVDIHNLIERAKTNAREIGLDKLSAVNPPRQGDEIDELVDRATGLIEEEELVKGLSKRAAVEHSRNMVIAKLLAAADVFAEVSR